MKNRLPTQIELAKLAASLPSGTAKERVQLAVEIWEESKSPTRVLGKVYSGRIKAHEKAISSEFYTWPLNKVLEHFMDHVTEDRRLEEWKKFRSWQRKNGARDAWAEDDIRRETVTLNHHRMMGEVEAWREGCHRESITPGRRRGGDVLWHVKKPKNAFGNSRVLTFEEIVHGNVAHNGMTPGKAREWAQKWKDCGDVVEAKGGKFRLRPEKNH